MKNKIILALCFLFSLISTPSFSAEETADGRSVNIKGTFSNTGHIPEKIPCTDHKTWSPMHFNKFEGSEALINISRPRTIVSLVPPQDFCEINIPEDGVYLFIVNYCWSSCPNTRYTGITIKGIVYIEFMAIESLKVSRSGL